MLKRAFGLSVVLLAAATLPLGAQSANAAVEDCPEGKVCVWTGPEYSGQLASTDRPTAACIDGISRSGWNRAEDLTVVLWTGPECTGDSFLLKPGQQSSVEDPPWRAVEVAKTERCLVGNLLCS